MRKSTIRFVLGVAILASIYFIEVYCEDLVKDLTEQRKYLKDATNDTEVDTIGGSRADEVIMGRGKHHKKKKLIKYTYPILVGVLIAKTIILPLIVKTATAVSSTSFVMSKIALIISGLLALKWIMNPEKMADGKSKVEIVHIEQPGKKYRHGWEDTDASGGYQHMYIPVRGAVYEQKWEPSGRHPQNRNKDKPFL